jgi:hypothetical protein
MFFNVDEGIPGSPAALTRGPPSMFFNVDGGRSRISDSTYQGGHHRHFLTLMVGIPGSLSAPAWGPAVNIF